jgi:hypothetical protein
MMEYRESHVSAYHNYLVNGMLTQGFVVGDPSSNNGFLLLADILPPGETTPRISSRLMDEKAHLLLEFDANRICENPGRCSIELTSDGYRVLRPSKEVLIEVRTRAFANGYLTLIKARLFDEHGHIRVETRDESIWVHGGEYLSLAAPLSEGISIRRE